jgi:inactivated superfamily I helicase
MLKKNNQESLSVFPTARSIRANLETLRNTNQLLNKNITISDLFQRAIIDNKNRKFCEKNLRILYLKEAISDVNIKELGLSGDFSTFLKQSDYIFRFFLETATEYFDIDKLLIYDTYMQYSDHIEILKQIYNNYLLILEKNNYTDNILMPTSYKLNNEYLEQFKEITIFFEGYLSSFEFKIIYDISQIIPIKIKLTLNEYNKKNIELFRDIKDDLKIDYSYTIDLTNNKIIDKIKQQKLKQNITISPISSQLEQIAFIKYQIAQIHKKGIEPHNIACIVPNEQISFALELFDDEHYFNFAMGRSIKLYKYQN